MGGASSGIQPAEPSGDAERPPVAAWPHCSGTAGAAAAAEGAVLSVRGSAAMAEPVREELSALAAIFCGPDEWEVLSLSGDYFRAGGTRAPHHPGWAHRPEPTLGGRAG